MNSQRRHQASDLRAADVPDQPGVYAWYHDGEAVYAGRALGRIGLRERIGKNHLGRGADLSRSSFRRDVCEYLGIAPTTVSKRRPTQLSAAQVEPVNQWIRECQVSWIVCDTADMARALEKSLLAEWMPPLSRR